MYSIGGHINGSSNSWCYAPNDETGIDFCVRGSASPKAVELKTNKTILALINLEAKLTSLV